MLPVNSRAVDLTLVENVLLCVKSLASGSFQNCNKDFVQVSQATLSRVLNVFVNSIVSKASRYVYIPRSEEERLRVVYKFKQAAGSPVVVGLPMAHIYLLLPNLQTNMPISIKKSSIQFNMSAICEASLIFLDVVIRCPESYFTLSSSNPRLCEIDLKMVNLKIAGRWVIVYTCSSRGELHHLVGPMQEQKTGLKSYIEKRVA